jgi:hypothetical protein
MADNFEYKLASYQIINSTVGTTGGVTKFTIHAGGTNYVVNDTITFSSGSSNCIISVAKVDAAGAVLQYWIIKQGDGYSVAGTTIATTTTSVAGADFTVVITGVTTVASTKRALSTAIPSVLFDGNGYFVHKVLVQALFSNTGFMAIGNTPVPLATNSVYSALTCGIQLAAGQVVELKNVNLDQVYMLPYVNNDGIMVTVYVRQTI